MKKSLLILLFPIIIGSCNLKNKPSKAPYSPYDESFYYVQNQDEMYKALFDHKNKIEMTLSFTNESLYNLQCYGEYKTIRKDMYHPCNMTLKINDITYRYDEIGARMKGNTSRNYNFVNSNGKFTKNGYNMNFKLSFNQTFDDEDDNDYYIRDWESKDVKKQRKNRRLGNQKKLDLKWNKNYDWTFSRASYAFQIYENEGIPAQKDNIIKFTIRTESDSLTYFVDMMESIDETFINNHILEEAQGGNLYKCLYPAKFTQDTISGIGIETPEWTPIYDLKTNDDEPDHSLLKNFINTINEDTSKPEEFKEKLEQLIDVDEVIKFSALNWVIGNPDDLRNNYNNFFTYFRGDNNKLVFLPYDLDRCFGILKDWPVHTENIRYDSTMQDLISNHQIIENPLFYRLFLESSRGPGNRYKVIEEYKNRYIKYCYEFANKYLSMELFKQFNDEFYWTEKDLSKSNSNGNLSIKEYFEKKSQLAPTNKDFVNYLEK